MKDKDTKLLEEAYSIVSRKQFIKKGKLLKECFYTSQMEEFLQNNPQIFEILMGDENFREVSGDNIAEAGSYIAVAAGMMYDWGPTNFSVESLIQLFRDMHVEVGDFSKETVNKLIQVLKTENIWTPPDCKNNLDNPSPEQVNYIKKHLKANPHMFEPSPEWYIPSKEDKQWMDIYHNR